MSGGVLGPNLKDTDSRSPSQSPTKGFMYPRDIEKSLSLNLTDVKWGLGPDLRDTDSRSPSQSPTKGLTSLRDMGKSQSLNLTDVRWGSRTKPERY